MAHVNDRLLVFRKAVDEGETLTIVLASKDSYEDSQSLIVNALHVLADLQGIDVMEVVRELPAVNLSHSLGDGSESTVPGSPADKGSPLEVRLSNLVRELPAFEHDTLGTVRHLQVVRYFCFVLSQSACVLLSAGLLLGVSYVLLRGGGAQLDMTRLFSTMGFSFALGAFGVWLLMLTRSEEQRIFRQQKFEIDEDQRRKDNATLAELLTKVDSLPAKTREKVIGDLLIRFEDIRQPLAKKVRQRKTVG